MNWYLVVDPPGDGAWNMAKDEHCLHLSIQLGRPILRIYHWQRLTLSLGRNQRPERKIDLEACQNLGINVVRRATGGQAVLHGSDLTYSVSAPLKGSGFEGGIMAVYREISRALVAFFERLALVPEVKAHTGRERVELASPVCFATPSAFEIMIEGRKLVGSAQRLLPDGFLQHGSIPLVPQERLLEQIFLGVEPDSLAGSMTNLEVLGLGEFTMAQLESLLAQAFLQTFEVGADPLPWSAEDQQAVTDLVEKYQFPLPEGELTPP